MRARPQKSGGAGNQSGIPTMHHSPRRQQKEHPSLTLKMRAGRANHIQVNPSQSEPIQVKAAPVKNPPRSPRRRDERFSEVRLPSRRAKAQRRRMRPSNPGSNRARSYLSMNPHLTLTLSPPIGWERRGNGRRTRIVPRRSVEQRQVHGADACLKQKGA